eukprot:NODE_1159_length_1970_cov_0.708177.p1 type:complete len:171 gc:universal NODE_1159_length_1970_cov_0.708177:1341-1853(+)
MGLTSQIKNVKNGQTKEINMSRKAMTRWDHRLEKISTELHSLIIGFSGLSNVSDAMGTFTNLTVLNLSGNRISLLPSMNSLQHLEYCNLSFNRLDAFPVGITNCKALVTLDLGGNRLRFIPTKVSQLEKLKSFYVNDNLITELPDEFCELKELRTVFIHLCRHLYVEIKF